MTSIAVIVPVFKERDHVLSVLKKIGDWANMIIVVDDACPQSTGSFVEENFQDSRLHVVRHDINTGVGGAVVSGYTYALEHGCEIMVKIDGDGQIDPTETPRLLEPLLEGDADYVKANRFSSREHLSEMPWQRLIGNAVYSFVSKASSGYWNLMDPTNGFTAIHRDVLTILPLDKIARDYFFESDLLFRLNILRAVVVEVPIKAHYGLETSTIALSDVLCKFPIGYLKSFCKRVLYSYFLHDFNAASLQLVFGTICLSFGFLFGIVHWSESILTGVPASTGTVMVAALPFIMGFQMLLNVLTYDAMNIPRGKARYNKL